ncbi:hypothetical protein H4217_006078 [Coemansia sp. RSA 1939]|nr:hypothetical protein H4217_006078 [Coemansia sp. RSA 1939]
MSAAKTGRVKFFNSQKGYGFVIPDEPIDGNAEVFVHHTVIYNAGGFKSLAEGEPVEFDLIRGPKGLQATKVTGPNGVHVRGDPYLRLMRGTRPPLILAATGSPDSIVNGSASTSSPYYHYAHFPQSSAYSQMVSYNGARMPQPHYASFTYAASSQPAAAVVPPPPIPPTAGFVVPPAVAMRDTHALVDASQIPAFGHYYGVGISSQQSMLQQQQQQQQLPPQPQLFPPQPQQPPDVINTTYETYIKMQQQPQPQQSQPQTQQSIYDIQPYTHSSTGTTSQMNGSTPQHHHQQQQQHSSAPPGFTSASRQESFTSQIHPVSSYTKFSD